MIVYQLLKVQDEAGVVAGKVQKTLLFPDFKSSCKAMKICTDIRRPKRVTAPALPAKRRGSGAQTPTAAGEVTRVSANGLRPAGARR